MSVPNKVPLREIMKRAGDSVPLRSFLLVLAAVALFVAPLLPLWRITLDAPQYPEGMGMLIWAHTLTGESPHDLTIINQLNHYIGMKPIVPESIPELKLMRPLILAFGFLCLLVAFRPRRWPVAALLVALGIAGAVGMVDFWMWEYDYGHDLDPAAAIKVPGATYQPPLIGTATLLNFESASWPAGGGLLLFLAGLLIAAAATLAWRGAKNASRSSSRIRAARFIPLPLAAALIACGDGAAVPIFWGEDACHHCRMTLMEKGYAAQRITSTGKAHKYDAIECLLAEIGESPLANDERIFVSDRSLPENPLRAAHLAVYLSGEHVPSPMGGGLAAFASRDSARAFQARLGGEILSWQDLSAR